MKYDIDNLIEKYESGLLTENEYKILIDELIIECRTLQEFISEAFSNATPYKEIVT